jgi:uncharacterized cofD-like protein
MSRHTLRRIFRWLYPGMGVKRWALVIGLSGVILVVGLMGLIGRENLKFIYEMLSGAGVSYPLLVGLILALGLAGVAFGVRQLVRSIVRGISPGLEGRASEIIYSRRLLRRGPQVVAVGGGTGLSTLLRGLKEWTSNITAVVTVMDDGGSSGRLRREMKILPPGDIRNCLIALAEDESKMARLFQHRFHDGVSALEGHSLGNLVLAGLQEMTGSFDRAVEELSLLLNVRGQVLPATLEDVQLVAEMDDGTLIKGECAIAESPKRIARMGLSMPRVHPYPKVLEAIRRADLIVLGPGSLYTSIIPNLLVEGIAHEIELARAVKIYIANLMTQPGETDGFTLHDHLRALGDYLDLKKLDFVLVNRQVIPEELRERYRSEGSATVAVDVKEPNEYGFRVIEADVLDIVEIGGEPTVKHHPGRLAQAIAKCTKQAYLERLR